MVAKGGSTAKREDRRKAITSFGARVNSNLLSAMQDASDRRWWRLSGQEQFWYDLKRGGHAQRTEQEVRAAIAKVEQVILDVTGPSAFTPGKSDTWPTNNDLYAEIAGATGIASLHLHELELGAAPTVDDIVLIAAYLNLDPVHMLLPSASELLRNDPIAMFQADSDELPEDAPNVLAHEYALWVLGLAALPTQDWNEFRENGAFVEIPTPAKSVRAKRDKLTALRDREARRLRALSAADLLPPLPADPADANWGIEPQTDRERRLHRVPVEQVIEQALAIRVLLRDILHRGASEGGAETPTRFERRGKQLTREIRRLWHILNGSGAPHG